MYWENERKVWILNSSPPSNETDIFILRIKLETIKCRLGGSVGFNSIVLFFFSLSLSQKPKHQAHTKDGEESGKNRRPILGALLTQLQRFHGGSVDLQPRSQCSGKWSLGFAAPVFSWVFVPQKNRFSSHKEALLWLHQRQRRFSTRDSEPHHGSEAVWAQYGSGGFEWEEARWVWSCGERVGSGAQYWDHS